MCFPPMNKDFIEELFLFASDLDSSNSFPLAEKTSFLCWCAWRIRHVHQHTPTLIFNNMDTVVRMGKKGR